jgi:hypothetical protein
VILTILKYNMGDYPKYLLISPAWHVIIQTALDQYTNQMENKFIQAYSPYLDFMRSYISGTLQQFCGKKGVRLDRVLVCEVSKQL